MADSPRVTVWSEFRHEKIDAAVRDIYPDGIHSVIGRALERDGFPVHTALLDQPEDGLSEEVLAETDVLVWRRHLAQFEVSTAVNRRIVQRVLRGMSLIVLHSGLVSDMFRGLMGTSCKFKWRDAAERQRVWTVDPGHPICDGLPESFEIPREELSGEY